MAEVTFTDEGFRDGPQSLWGSRMSTETMVDGAALVDAAGYEKSVVVSGATFEAAVQHLREDPWQRLDAVTALLPNTPPVAQIRGRTLFGWKQYPDDVLELFMATLAKHGIEWFLVYDALNDMRLIEQHVRVAHRLGLRVTVPICYSVSPVHTPEYFAYVIGQAVGMGAEGVSLLDASGLLSPAATEQLVGAARTALAGSDTALEMNVHDLTGRGLACYQAALRAGVDVFASVPLAVAYDRSIPAVTDTLAAAAAAGRTATLDRLAVDRVDDYFAWAAHLQGQPVPVSTPLTGDELEAFVGHQIPGGMMSNLVTQLRDLGIEDRLPEILTEVTRVRAEFGYPVMVTPCSQMIGVQATLNVVSGQRYASVPTEVKNYFAGVYGTPPGKLDEDVLDRVLGDEPTVDPYEPLTEPMLPRFEQEHGPFDSAEDLLLAVLYSTQAVSTFNAQKRSCRTRPRRPETALVAAVLERLRPTRLRVRL